jgi:hypothetical protein
MVQNQISCAKRHKDWVVSLKGQKPRSWLLFGEYINKNISTRPRLSDVPSVTKRETTLSPVSYYPI